MWIAPSRYGNNWTSADWNKLDFTSEESWPTAVDILEDRIRYRYLDAVQTLKEEDDSFYRRTSQRRYGFAVLALDCLLLETLAQFYAGLKDSDEARTRLGENNTVFYSSFLTQRSLILKNHFDDQKARLFYRTVRCGILHQAETQNSTLVRYVCEPDRSRPLELSADRLGLTIYWAAFHELVEAEFATYCACLRAGQPIEYRDHFVRKMNFICHKAEVA